MTIVMDNLVLSRICSYKFTWKSVVDGVDDDDDDDDSDDDDDGDNGNVDDDGDDSDGQPGLVKDLLVQLHLEGCCGAEN